MAPEAGDRRPLRAILVIGIAIVAIIGLTLVFVPLGGDEDSADSFTVGGHPLYGQPAPEIELATLDGESLTLSSLAGRPVLINFWATYCVPCYYEHPLFLEASRRFAGEVHFLGVIYQDDPALIEQFLRARGAWGPSLVDDSGKVAIAYGVFGPPETFFIDPNGVIIEKVMGAVSAPMVQGLIESML